MSRPRTVYRLPICKKCGAFRGARHVCPIREIERNRVGYVPPKKAANQ
jgi:ribosomal protein L32